MLAVKHRGAGSRTAAGRCSACPKNPSFFMAAAMSPHDTLSKLRLGIVLIYGATIAMRHVERPAARATDRFVSGIGGGASSQKHADHLLNPGLSVEGS